MTAIVADKSTAHWLEGHGYALHFRTATWTEVLVSNAQEQWWGRGPTEEAALTHALQGMFPSHAARVLLAGIELHSRKPAEPLPAVPTPAEVLEPPPPQLVEKAAEQQPPPPPEPPPEEAPSDARADVSMPSRELPAPAPPASLVDAPAVAAKAAELLQRFQRMEAELALCSSDMQRVVLVEWMAACRDLEAQAGPKQPTALNTARKIIGRVSGRWWPGSMPVLQRGAGLVEARKQLTELGLGPVDLPQNWAHAEQLAVEVRERLEADLGKRGLEPSGYRKSVGPRPRPEAANARLATTAKELENLRPVEAKAKQYERAALTLRWIRTQVDDPPAWADAWGKLREVLHKSTNEKWLKHALRWLDPATVPAKGFAAELGIDPEERARSRRRKDLAKTLSGVADDDVEGVVAWFERSADDFTAEELRRLCADHMQAIRAITEDHFRGPEHRGTRKKLGKVRDAAAQSEPPTPSAPEPADDDAASVEMEASGPLPGEALVRAAMQGKRCVLVTNRPEQDLCDDLATRTGMQVDVCLNQARKLDGVVDSIKSGKVAVVMLVTSFIGHHVDAKIQDACRGSAAKMLRVRKGKARVLMEELVKHVGANGHQRNGHLSI